MQNAFTIDSHTGEIKVNMDIDREKTQQFVLGVQAKDGKKEIGWGFPVFDELLGSGMIYDLAR